MDKPTGDLAALGFKGPTNVERDAGVEDLDPQESASEILQDQGEEEAPVVDSTPGAFIADTAAEEEEDALEADEPEGDEYDQLVARAVSNARKTEEVEDTSAPQAEAFNYAAKLGALEATAQAKIDAVDAKLKEYESRETVVEDTDPEDAALDLSDPRMIKAFQDASDDPAAMAKLVGAVVAHEAQRLSKEQVGPLQAQVESMVESTKSTTEQQELGAAVSAGLQAAFQMGGIEAAIVREYAENEDSSLLVQYLRANVDTPKTQQGIMSAVMTIARAVQRENDLASDSQDEEKPTPKLVGKRGGTVASQRGTQSLKKHRSKPKDGDEELRQSIINARPQSKKLKFMNG